ncbi:MAG: multicopper oxidase family protein [Hyphomicrobiales bacterium]
MAVGLSRRSAIKGLAAAAAAAPACRLSGAAQASSPAPLRAVSRVIEVNGKSAKVYGLIGPHGRPGLELQIGQRFTTGLVNDTTVETLIHWHGLTPPSAQDGVPMLSQAPLQPGGRYDYEFENRKSGTNWMHSHVGLQEQQMLAAPLIVRETDQPLWDEQEHVVMLHDFTFRDPAEILAELRGGGGHAGHSMPGMYHSGTGQGGGMAMAAMLNDVTFDAYLANDRGLDDPEIVAVESGGQVRLRIINAAAASNMWIDLGGLEGELIAVDGHAVYPVRGSLFPLAVAQRADIRLRLPAEGGAFPVLFRPEGLAVRTGLVLATPGAEIARIAGEGGMTPAVDLSLERRLKAVAEIRNEPVSRTEIVVLTGGAADYVWGLNGKPSMHEALFAVKPGERIEIVMNNKTGMAHPMHLHGHYFKVTAIGGTRLEGALRDTILVPPKESVTIQFDADNPGTWAFHCHHIYHMNSGMMGAIAYTSAA